jgi:hypothetical protein
VVGLREHDDKPSGSIKKGRIISDKLSDNNILHYEVIK